MVQVRREHFQAYQLRRSQHQSSSKNQRIQPSTGWFAEEGNASGRVSDGNKALRRYDAQAVGGTSDEIYKEIKSNLLPNAHMVPAGIVAVSSRPGIRLHVCRRRIRIRGTVPGITDDHCPSQSLDVPPTALIYRIRNIADEHYRGGRTRTCSSMQCIVRSSPLRTGERQLK